MAIYSRTSQYLGINAHLHNSLQNEFDAWGMFHGYHISHLFDAIEAALPPGYIVQQEKGLQIREFHPDTGEPIAVHKRRPDLAIYETPFPTAQTTTTSPVAAAPTLTLTAMVALEDNPKLHYQAVVVRELLADNKIGKAITWIELLSPTNKPHGSGFFQYRDKQAAVLRAGITFVEIDYLHQTPPVILRLPSYPDGEPGAFPYMIIVTNPRPSLMEGILNVYGINVDEALPVVEIPLAGEDAFPLDFGAAYNRTFSGASAYSVRVDYEQLPARFDTYNETDQARIQARMAAVAQAIERGVALEEGPFPLGESAA